MEIIGHYLFILKKPRDFIISIGKTIEINNQIYLIQSLQIMIYSSSGVIKHTAEIATKLNWLITNDREGKTRINFFKKLDLKQLPGPDDIIIVQNNPKQTNSYDCGM